MQLAQSNPVLCTKLQIILFNVIAYSDYEGEVECASVAGIFVPFATDTNALVIHQNNIPIRKKFQCKTKVRLDGN